ncbi:MAG TPA: squalene synthase HpnC [Candidatus Acidoferrales bacterium]|nr:squalene synthase HpnC [Candidatus Acidoferrales bacterium]
MATARANVQSGPLYAAGGVPTAAPPPGTFDVASAYAFCTRLAKSHYENFTIASWLMPRQMRPHMHAIYAYARMADDFADEHHDLAMLDAWERELDSAYAGAPRHPVFIALADTVRKFKIPREPFLDLLAAFRSDVEFKGFDTLDELLGYSRNSANPVGRLVLYLFGYRDAARQHLSDLVCSGLQLANFWQDVAVDLDKRRIYLPRRDMERFGVDASMLAALRAGAECGAPFVELMRHEVEVARAMLLEGGELRNQVDARLRRDIAMFAGGGLAILRAIERINYDVFRKRPELTKLDYLSLGWNAIRGRLEG